MNGEKFNNFLMTKRVLFYMIVYENASVMRFNYSVVMGKAFLIQRVGCQEARKKTRPKPVLFKARSVKEEVSQCNTGDDSHQVGKEAEGYGVAGVFDTH